MLRPLVLVVHHDHLWRLRICQLAIERLVPVISIVIPVPRHPRYSVSMVPVDARMPWEQTVRWVGSNAVAAADTNAIARRAAAGLLS